MYKIEDIENKILLGDCISELSAIPDATIDLIFADPPYNLQLQNSLYRPNQTKVSAVEDLWDKFQSFQEYDDFSYSWLKECQRVLKKNGAIWVIGTYHNIYRLGKIIQDLGYWILNDISWIKTNPMPNFKGTRFNNAHETLIWASKNSKSKAVFHYRSMKVSNDDKQMRSEWNIPICIGGERIKINGGKAHSTQKPEALLKRIIIATSNAGDLILDPFMGSGTTGAMAKLLRRRYVGIEKEERYKAIADERINSITHLGEELLGYEIEVKKPRVPFGSLVEVEYIKPGNYLYSKGEKHKALVLADSSINLDGNVGSIHKIGALAQSTLACNGWEFWFLKRGNRLISINDLRNEYIEKFIPEA